MQVTKIIAKNPSSIMIVLGIGLYTMGDSVGLLVMLVGVVLNIYWISRRS